MTDTCMMMFTGVCVCVFMYLLMVRCDEPELYIHSASSFFCSNEVKDIFMFHSTHTINLIFILP